MPMRQCCHPFEIVWRYCRHHHSLHPSGLRRFGITRGIAHAFNGSAVQAQAFLRQGLVLGFGGAMTFARALQIRRLAQSLPGDAWVLETDSPDIAPAWLEKGATNTPDQTPAIGAVMAGLSVDDAAACSSRNACRALPRLLRHAGRYEKHPNNASQSR
jgi:TatD DNase family protein